MPNLSKPAHQELLSEIERLKFDADTSRGIAARERKRADGLASDLAAKTDLEGNYEESLKRGRELHRMVSVRETAIVQIGLRLAAYGDPDETEMED